MHILYKDYEIVKYLGVDTYIWMICGEAYS